MADMVRVLIIFTVLMAVMLVQSVASAGAVSTPVMDHSNHHEMAQSAQDCDHAMDGAATSRDTGSSPCSDHGTSSHCAASVCCAHGMVSVGTFPVIATLVPVGLWTERPRTGLSRMDTPQDRPPRRL